MDGRDGADEDIERPLGVIRCLFDEALRAIESGRYRALAVRMNV